MKVTVRDSAFLKTIEPEELAAHLRTSGWHEHGRVYNDAGAIWRGKHLCAEKTPSFCIRRGFDGLKEFLMFSGRVFAGIRHLSRPFARSRQNPKILGADFSGCLDKPGSRRRWLSSLEFRRVD